MSGRELLIAVQQACPDGHEVHVLVVRDLEDFRPGDVVLGYRPDNGERGRHRIRAGVHVARYEPIVA